MATFNYDPGKSMAYHDKKPNEYTIRKLEEAFCNVLGSIKASCREFGKVMEMRDSESALVTKMEELKYEIEVDTRRLGEFFIHLESGCIESETEEESEKRYTESESEMEHEMTGNEMRREGKRGGKREVERVVERVVESLVERVVQRELKKKELARKEALKKDEMKKEKRSGGGRGRRKIQPWREVTTSSEGTLEAERESGQKDSETESE